MTTNQTIDGVPRECRECGSTALSWFAQNTVPNGIQQNRLNTSDVQCVFVLGCDDCSETLKIISADKIAEHFNKPAAQPQGEPIYQLEYLGEGGGGWNDVDKATYDRFERLPNYRPRIVYAEQPAPVAVVLPDLWQPIETAPKDGTEIILRKGDRVTSGAWTEWSKAEAEFHGSTGAYLGQVEYDSGALWSSWDGGFCDDDHPTHWQPLPTVTPQQ